VILPIWYSLVYTNARRIHRDRGYYDLLRLYGKIFTKLLAKHCKFYVLGTVTTKGQIKLLVHTLDKVPTTQIMFVKSFVTC